MAGVGGSGARSMIFQPAGVESVDAGPGAGQISEHDLALAFVAGADVDVAGKAGAPHHVAFGHAERDAAHDLRSARRLLRQAGVGLDRGRSGQPASARRRDRRRPSRPAGRPARSGGGAGGAAGAGAASRDRCAAAAVGADQFLGRDRPARAELDVLVVDGGTGPVRLDEYVRRLGEQAALVHVLRADPSELVQPAMGIANSPAHKKSAILETTRRRKTISPATYPLVP